MGFDGGYSIVKAYVSSRKMDLNEKATVRFETMPGKYSPLLSNIRSARNAV